MDLKQHDFNPLFPKEDTECIWAPSALSANPLNKARQSEPGGPQTAGSIRALPAPRPPAYPSHGASDQSGGHKDAVELLIFCGLAFRLLALTRLLFLNGRGCLLPF